MPGIQYRRGKNVRARGAVPLRWALPQFSLTSVFSRQSVLASANSELVLPAEPDLRPQGGGGGPGVTPLPPLTHRERERESETQIYST